MTRTTKEQRDEAAQLAERLRGRTFSRWESDIQTVVDYEDEDATKAAETILALLDEIEGAEKEEKEGIAVVLRPFALSADAIERDYGADVPDSQIQFPRLTMGDLRKARALYAAPVPAKVTEEMVDGRSAEWWSGYADSLSEAAVLAEREACAVIAENMALTDWMPEIDKVVKSTARQIAAAIRARGQAALSHKGGGNG